MDLVFVLIFFNLNLHFFIYTNYRRSIIVNKSTINLYFNNNYKDISIKFLIPFVFQIKIITNRFLILFSITEKCYLFLLFYKK